MFLLVSKDYENNPKVNTVKSHCNQLSHDDQILIEEIPTNTDAVKVKDVSGNIVIVGSNNSDCTPCQKKLIESNSMIFVPRHFVKHGESNCPRFPAVIAMKNSSFSTLLKELFQKDRHFMLPSHKVQREYNYISSLLTLSYDDIVNLWNANRNNETIVTFMTNLVKLELTSSGSDYILSSSTLDKLTTYVDNKFNDMYLDNFVAGAKYIMDLLSDEETPSTDGDSTELCDSEKTQNLIKFLEMFMEMAMIFYIDIYDVNSNMDKFKTKFKLSESTDNSDGYKRVKPSNVQRIHSIDDLINPIVKNRYYEDIVLVSLSENYPVVTDVYLGLYNEKDCTTTDVSGCVYVHNLWDVGFNGFNYNSNQRMMSNVMNNNSTEINRLVQKLDDLSEVMKSDISNGNENNQKLIKQEMQVLNSKLSGIEDSINSNIDDVHVNVDSNFWLLLVVLSLSIGIIVMFLFLNRQSKVSKSDVKVSID